MFFKQNVLKFYAEENDMKFNASPVRGTVDYLPTEMEVRSYAEKIILETYKQNGFLQIKTPILENLEILTNGDSGDNQKLMFKTIKRGDKLDLAKPNLKESDIVEEGLRYDLTVPLVRLYAGNKESLPSPFKAIQIDESFRAERPQKGRVRQFTQCDIDILGDSSPFAEIELLYAYMCAYQKLGFNKLTIKVNDRRVLNELITKAGFSESEIMPVCVSLDKFDKIGTAGVVAELAENGYSEKNTQKLMAMFDTLKTAETNEACFEILKNYQISQEIINSLKLIIETASKFKFDGIKIVYDVSIIRGQGYYTGTVFEVFDDDFGRAIGGGGRYDKMIEKFLGTPVPAVGCSIGLYVVVMLMNERGYVLPSKKLALVYDKGDSYSDVLSEKIRLMDEGYEVAVFAFPKNFANFALRLKNNGYTKLEKMKEKGKIIDL